MSNRRSRLKTAFALAGGLLVSTQASPPRADGAELFDEFQAICLDGDGRAEDAAEAALARGYSPSQHLVPDDLFQNNRLTVFSKVDNGVEWRITTRPSAMSSAGEGAVAQNRCHVAADPGDLRGSRAVARERLAQDSFKQGDTQVFAWILAEDGAIEPVSSARFDRNLIRLIKRDGLRFVTVARHGDQVIMGYFTPNDQETCTGGTTYRICRRASPNGEGEITSRDF